MDYTLTDLSITDPSQKSPENFLSVQGGEITYQTKFKKTFSIGNDFHVYPSFINLNDRISETFFPRMGINHYSNFNSWQDDLKNTPLLKEANLFTPQELTLFNALKNILAGTLWVGDPTLESSFIDTSSIALNLELYKDLIYEANTDNGNAFKDNPSPSSLFIKQSEKQIPPSQMSFLKNQSNLTFLNPFSLTDQDIDFLKKNHHNLILSPTSNYLLFNDILPLDKILKEKIPFALSTNSAMNGSMNLLEEIQNVAFFLKENLKSNYDSKDLFSSITTNPAKIMNIPAGTLQENSPANLIITSKILDDPFDNILQLKLNDIKLVIKNGKPLYGDPHFIDIFDFYKNSYWKILVEDEKKILAIRGYNKLLKKVKQSSYPKHLPFVPLELIH